jgi:hypothetical protein
MENISVKILRTISEIETKPKMVMMEPNYTALKNLFIGYFIGIEDVTGISFNRQLSEYFRDRSVDGAGASLFWTEHILYILAERDQEKAYKLLLTHLRNYFEKYLIAN